MFREICRILGKSWVQWALAALIIFSFSFLYMGREIYNCSSATSALGSDSTGGFGWIQWASGNGFSWGHTDKSNYPFGENLGKPQYITSAILIFTYKLFSAVSTPICGLNLLTLLGYMSSGLVMFGLVRWLFKRFDIAIFAAYAAAFVPYHQIKSYSHINYIYGGIFIGIIWSYLWLYSRPSFKRSVVFALASIIGFYFDGYFVMISSFLMAGLISSSYIYALLCLSFIKDNPKRQQVINKLMARTKYLAIGLIMVSIVVVPILVTYTNNSLAIKQSLSSVRSNIKSETLLYGLRPIELVTPAYNNPLMPNGYQAWRATKLHGSNFSEDSLYVGYTIIVLALIGIAGWFFRSKIRPQLPGLAYRELVFIIIGAFILCFLFSLPYKVTLFGHTFRTPSLVLIKLTANWRVLARLFLAMDPLLIILASAGLYFITRSRGRLGKLVIVLLSSGLLFVEYLPASFGSAPDLYKDAPSIYKQIRDDRSVKIVAEYPLADFKYTPTIFTYQPVYNKPLLNANDGSISRGPFDSAIAGLNDPQTLGVLKKLDMDVVIVHAAQVKNQNLSTYLFDPVKDDKGNINVQSSLFSYKLNPSLPSRDSFLVMQTGFSDLSVDDAQISHRYLIAQGTMRVTSVRGDPVPRQSSINFYASSACLASTTVTIFQSARVLWSGKVEKSPVSINFTANDQPFYIKTTNCVVDITKLDSRPLPVR